VCGIGDPRDEESSSHVQLIEQQRRNKRRDEEKLVVQIFLDQRHPPNFIRKLNE
jgi:hypothetical protein